MLSICYTGCISLLGPHITAWMKREVMKYLTVKSIANWEGSHGKFVLYRWKFIKADNAILLVVKGKLCLSYEIESKIIFDSFNRTL